MRQLKVLPSITKRDSESVERYLRDIVKIELLDVNEEHFIGSKARNGDAEAMDRLIKSNLRFVVSVAKSYAGRGLSLCDLISEGNIGLMTAAKRFDPTMGFKFITFAVWWIRQAMVCAIAKQRNAVRLPANQVAAIAKIKAAGLKLEQKLERTPGIEELAEYTGFTEQQVAGVMDAGLMHYSLDRTAEGEPGHSLLDILADKSTRGTDHLAMGTSLLADIERIIRRLPKREQKVLMMFYGINGNPPSSLKDMEVVFNLGSERLRQIKDKAQKTLRSKYRVALADYF